MDTVIDCSTPEGQRKAAEAFYRIDRAHKAHGLPSPISYGKDRPDSLRPPRGRAPRAATNARNTGSQRSTTSAQSPCATRAGPDDDPHLDAASLAAVVAAELRWSPRWWRRERYRARPEQLRLGGGA